MGTAKKQGKLVPVTHRIYETAFRILKRNPKGLRWTELLTKIKASDPSFHPKTVNGCVWKLVERFPERVERTKDGLFRGRFSDD